MTEIEGMREIDIRLTRDRSFLSYLIYFMGGGGLTHASIGLDREDGFFYSFNTKGYRKEYLHPRKKRVQNTATYRIRVSEESYRQLKERLTGMYERREEYGYYGFGVALCFMRVPFRFKYKKKYFCSQFVVESLTETGCIRIKKIPEHCFPNKIGRVLKKSDQLVDVSYTRELVPAPKLLLDRVVLPVPKMVWNRVLVPVPRTVAKQVLTGKDYVVAGVMKYTLPFLYRSAYESVLKRLWVRLNLLRYMKKIRKLMIYMMWEQYREIFSKGEKKNG